jgi:isopenicillin N synthase-like dioxygenase
VFTEARRFFALPPAAKLAVASPADGPSANRGYAGVGSQRLDADADVDRKESFMIGTDLAPDHPRVLAGKPFAACNRWPHLPGFADALLAYQAAARDLAQRLLRGIALSLDLDEDHFVPYHQDPILGLRLLRYPARRGNASSREYGAGAHTDWGAITVLAQDGVGSLQVRGPDGGWIEVPPDPDAYTINLGDLIEVWTNGRYRSTVHRVLGADRERYSAALFCDLDAEAVIECLPTCTGPGNPPRYAPTTAARHLRRKYEETMVH